MTTNNPPSPKMFPGILPFFSISLVFLVSVLILTSPSSSRSQPPVNGGKSVGMPLVRGYVAAAVSQDKPNPDGPPAPGSSRDVFLPGVTVFLHDLVTNTDTSSVRTDLSGRFTLRAPHAGRYTLCWKAEGFESGICSDVVAVGSNPVHVGTIRIKPDRRGGTTAVFGSVRMKDGTRGRTLEPMFNVNSFARVGLYDASNNLMQEVYVNNFGEYLMPQVPARQHLVLRARIEGATSEQRILPQANLAGALFQPVNLVVGNTAPRVEPVVPAYASGRRVRAAKPGDKIELEARATDSDGDPLRYRWQVADGSGVVSTKDQPKTTWNLPGHTGQFTATLLAFDGKGGYAKSAVSLRVDNLGVLFSGKIDGTDGLAVAGAEVEINGQTAFTGATGAFQVRIKDADRFVFNIRKQGYALLSRIYDRGIAGGEWTVVRATVTSVDPTRDFEVVNERQPRDCPGPLSARLDWKGFPRAVEPQWQDGKGNVVAPFGRLEVPIPGKKPQRENKCGPGIRVRIPGNALQDARGLVPVGNVQVAVATYELGSGEQMPGDYTVKLPDGSTRVMQSYGAGFVEIRSGAQRLNLRPGATAEVIVPVDPEQLASGAALPPTIPLLSYDERNGVWIEDGTATLQGNAYVAKARHFSAINMDLLKVNQACVRVLSPTLPANYKLEITVPMGGGAAPLVRTEMIDNSPPSEHVLYNLPTNTNIVLVPIRLSDNVPIGTFVVNTGGQQNPTSPNLPAGPPYHACSTQVTLSDQVVPPVPLSGEFLHGLYSFSATNLDELDPADPTQNALKLALDQASANYYSQIDPRGKRLTLADFKTTNGFGTPAELRAIYANSGDLGFGRDMHCVRVGDDVAAYVTNYGDIDTSDSADVVAAISGANPVATVAMEYSRIESPPGNPTEFDDTDRVVKFYVYNADGTALLKAANLDGLGARPIPQLCMVCHGGEYPGGAVLGSAPPFNSRNDVKLRSQFIPFDLHYFTFGPPPFDKVSQQAVFKSMNETIVKNLTPNPGNPANPAVDEIITKMYAAGPTQDENFVAGDWGAPAAKQVMYRDVVARSCRTCHSTNTFPAIRFDLSSQFIDRLGSIEARVCVQHVMPHAKRTHELFWTSVGPHMPAQLQVFGDTFGNALNGWQGTQCGSFTAGGATPPSPYAPIQAIWDANCTACHIGGSPPAGLNLSAASSYANLVNVNSTQVPSMKRIKPNDPANSYLFHKINGTQTTVGGFGSQMPQGGPPLSAATKTVIQSWINSGAPGP